MYPDLLWDCRDCPLFFRLMPEAALLPVSIGQMLIGLAAIWLLGSMEIQQDAGCGRDRSLPALCAVITGLLAAGTGIYSRHAMDPDGLCYLDCGVPIGCFGGAGKGAKNQISFFIKSKNAGKSRIFRHSCFFCIDKRQTLLYNRCNNKKL